jgi:hypothetical protein
MLGDSRLVRAAQRAMGEIWRYLDPVEEDSTRLCVEALERRLLLTSFGGTSAADTITISAYGEKVYVDINGVKNQSSDEYDNISAEGGNDTIIIGEIVSDPSWKPQISVDLGDGNDLVAADGATLDTSNDGVVFLTGGAGTDKFEVDSTDSTRMQGFEFNTDAIGPYLQAGPLHDGGFFHYDSSLENLTLDCNSQNNIVKMIDKPGATHVAVNGDDGNDEFVIGAFNAFLGTASDFSTPSAGWLAGTTTLSGGVGNDSVEYYDRYASVDPGGYVLTNGNITKGSAGVSYVTLETQTLDAADGNVINVNSTNVFTSTDIIASNCTINLNSLISPTTVNGSDCTVNAGNGNLDNIAAPVTLNMSTILNADLLNINDQNATTDTTYIFDAGSVTARNSANPIDFTGLDQIVLQAGLGNDSIAVDQVAAGESLAVFGNAGNDTLILSQADVHDTILAPVSLNGGAGTDTLFIGNALAACDGVLTDDSYTEAGITNTYVNCEILQFVGGVMKPTNLDIESLNIPATISGGSSADTYEIGGGNLDAVRGQISIDGKGGNDSLLVDDRFGPTAEGFTIDSGLISTNVSYIETANIESETVQGSDHDDSFNIRSSVADLNILGNGGNDLIFSQGGTANIDTGSETPNTAGDSVLVNFGGSGSTLRLLNDDRIGDIDIYNGGVLGVPAGVTLDVASLNAYAGSVLDMNGAMIARNASAALDQFGARLSAGYHNGSWDGQSTAPTIISSLAHSSAIKDSVGYALAGNLLNISGSQTGSWQGQTINPGDVLVKYTYAGDANLDGRINIDDYGRIDSNVGRSGTVFGWYNGDFNFDAKINIDDYGIIDSGIGAQGSPIEQIGIDNSPASE